MPWLERCAQSIANQTYRNFDVCFIDDASPGGQEADFLATFCREQNARGEGDWNLIIREENVGVLRNQHDAQHLICENDDDVVVIVDSDDFFASPDSLKRLDQHYDDHTWMTYGNYKSVPYSKTCPSVKAYPPEVIANRSFREFTAKHGVLFNHLRTWRWKLWKHIDPEVYFIRDGEWLRNSVDLNPMIAMLEAAGTHHKFIDEVLLAYNSENPLSFWRIAGKEMAHDDHWTLTRPVVEPYHE